MTREEAIQVLQTALTSPFIYGDYAKALRVAIEALEMQNNCIICPRCGREFSEYEGRKQSNEK